MPYDIPRPSGYRIQPFKLQDDEALVAAMAQQLLKARLAQARAASGGGGGGGGGGRGKKEKGEWVMKYNPETKRYDKVWVAGGTGDERKINMKGEDFNKTADWLDSNPEAQRLLGVLRNGNASNKAKQAALSEFRSLKGSEALSGMSPEAVDEVIERQAKPYKEQVETEKKEIAGAGKGLLSSIEIGLDRLGTFFSTIGDDAETTLAKRRASLERQQAIREADPYLREQSRREAEGEGLLERSDGATGVAANVAGALLGDPSAVPIAVGAGLGATVGGPVGAGIGASIAGAGGAASGDTYLGERLAMDDRLSEAEKEQAYEEGKMSEMGINAAVNAIPFGGAAAVRAGRTALAAAGRGALGREAAEGAAAFARGGAWRTAADTASYAERFGGFAGEAAEQAVAKAAVRPIAADLVRQSERGVMGAIKYNAVPEAAMASGLNAGAMLESNVHYNELTGQNDSITQNVPEAAAMGLLFGIPAGIGGAIRSRRMAAELTSPETRLAGHQQELERQGKVGENLPAAAPASASAASSSTGPGTEGGATAGLGSPTGRPSPGSGGAQADAGPSAAGTQGGRAYGPDGRTAFSDAERDILDRLYARRDEWEAAADRRWMAEDSEYASAKRAFGEQVAKANASSSFDAYRQTADFRQAESRFYNAIARLMLRDRDILFGGAGARAEASAKPGAQKEATSGEGTVSGTGEGAAVSGAEPAGEAGARQADTGNGGALGAYPQNAAGTDASGVSAPAGVRNPQNPGSGTGGGTGGSTPALENSAGGIGIAWAGRQPNGKRAVGKPSAGPAAAVRTAADQGAGGAQPPAKPVAGSPAPRRGAEAALTVADDRAGNILRNDLGRFGDSRLKQSTLDAMAKNLAKQGLDESAVARFMDVFPHEDSPLFLNREKNAGFTPGMQVGILKLADHYNLPVVSSRSISEASLGAGGQRLVSALNGYFAELHSRGALGSRFSATRELRTSRVGSDRWIDSATGLLNTAMRDARENGTSGVLDANFFRDNFPERWRDQKPIEVADVAEMLDPKKTLEKDFDATNDGTPFCAR